jgi:hypothetical protein
MTNSFSTEVEVQARRLSREASPWITRLARLGYAARGVVYCLVGALAAQAALGEGGRTTGTEGALQTLLRQPFGRGLLAVMALGLIGYSIWRFVQALKDPEHAGANAAGMGKRVGYFLSGALHASLSAVAIKMLMGRAGGGQEEQTRDWTVWLMSLPWGIVLVGFIGAGILGFGLLQLYRAWTVQLEQELELRELRQRARQWVVRFGRLGLAARGVVFSLIGASFIAAAMNANPQEAQGFGGALQTLREQAYGPWLLGVVALGLIAYGLYQMVIARYQRLRPV